MRNAASFGLPPRGKPSAASCVFSCGARPRPRAAIGVQCARPRRTGGRSGRITQQLPGWFRPAPHAVRKKATYPASLKPTRTNGVPAAVSVHKTGGCDEVGHARSPRLKPIAVPSLIFFSATGPKRADYPHLARLVPSNPAPSIRRVQEPRTQETLNSKVKLPIGPLTRHYEWATVPFQSSDPPFEGYRKTIRLSFVRSPAPGETACTRMERLALREEGKEACARAEVSETAEMGGETVERVKPLCTCFERAILKRER